MKLISQDNDKAEETVEYMILEREEEAASVCVKMQFGRPEVVSHGQVRSFCVFLTSII